MTASGTAYQSFHCFLILVQIVPAGTKEEQFVRPFVRLSGRREGFVTSASPVKQGLVLPSPEKVSPPVGDDLGLGSIPQNGHIPSAPLALLSPRCSFQR